MRKIAFFIGLVFFTIGLIVLPHYAQNWDESLHFNRGQAFLRFFITGKTDYGDLKPVVKYYQKEGNLFFDPVGKKKADVNRRSIYMDNQIDFTFVNKGYGHPPFSDIIASFFNFVLFQRLGIINDVDSYHIYSVFLASILVAVIFFWTAKKYGIFAGLVASLSLALYPLFLGESHFNIKDIPEAVFYSLTIITFYEGAVRRSNKWLIISAVFCGFALGTKFNIVFAPFILLPWLTIYLISKRTILKKYLKLIPSSFLYLVIPIAIFYVTYPILWWSPIGNLLKIINFYQSIGNDQSFDPRFISYFGINIYALKWVLYTTPLVILFFSFVGGAYALIKGFKEKEKILLLVLLWFLIPIIRVTRPEAGIYGGLRQIVEFVPAMAILAGVGANFMVKWLNNYIIKLTKKQFSCLILQLLVILSFIPITLKLISIHPNEGIYFNPLIGGLMGAKEERLPGWGESLGNPYRQATDWLNKNAEKNAKIAVNFGIGSSIPGILIRDDIKYSNTFRSALERKGEYIIGLTHDSGFEDTYFFEYLDKFLTPVYEVKVDGVPILRIWKNDMIHTKSQYKDMVLITDKPKINTGDNLIEIDIGKVGKLVKMLIVFEGTCAKEVEEGFVELASDDTEWIRLDGDLGGQRFLPTSTYQGVDEFKYFFAAIQAQYIRINFVKENSCFKHIEAIKIYGLKD